MKSILLFLKLHMPKALIAVLAFFAPAKPLLLAAVIFAICDFATGITAAIKRKEKLSPPKMQKKVFDVSAYMVAIIASFYFEKLFLDWVNFPLCKIVSFIIISVEFWSNMENISSITGIPLSKTAIMAIVNKLRPNTNNSIEPSIEESQTKPADNQDGV